MRIKLDENLPTGLVPLLTALGHEVDTVPAEVLVQTGVRERAGQVLRDHRLAGGRSRRGMDLERRAAGRERGWIRAPALVDDVDHRDAPGAGPGQEVPDALDGQRAAGEHDLPNRREVLLLSVNDE